METILNLKQVTTASKIGGRRPQIIIETTKRTHWVTVGMWIAAGLSFNFEMYKGGTLAIDYAKKGDKLFTPKGQEQRYATADDVIVADFAVQADSAKVAAAFAAEVIAKEREAVDMSLLFKRRRDAVQEGALSVSENVDTNTGEIEGAAGPKETVGTNADETEA